MLEHTPKLKETQQKPADISQENTLAAPKESIRLQLLEEHCRSPKVPNVCAQTDAELSAFRHAPETTSSTSTPLQRLEEHLRSSEMAGLCAQIDAELNTPGYVPETMSGLVAVPTLEGVSGSYSEPAKEGGPPDQDINSAGSIPSSLNVTLPSSGLTPLQEIQLLLRSPEAAEMCKRIDAKMKTQEHLSNEGECRDVGLFDMDLAVYAVLLSPTASQIACEEDSAADAATTSLRPTEELLKKEMTPLQELQEFLRSPEAGEMCKRIDARVKSRDYVPQDEWLDPPPDPFGMNWAWLADNKD